MTKREQWKWFGHAEHLIVAQWCRFHLCTQVGQYLISTVGEYVPDETVREIHANTRGIILEGRGDARLADYMKKCGCQDIGCDRKYETMVFKLGKQRCISKECGCGLPTPDDWSEWDGKGYNSAGDATKGHYKMCQKWSKKS